MVSSTFSQLKQHRAAVIAAIEGAGLHHVAMEQDSALPDGSVIDASLQKVRDAAAYVGIIGHTYGQIPRGPNNPERLSLTQLEFREARRLRRPMLIFIMGQNHPVTVAGVESNRVNIKKLKMFREEVKRLTEDPSPDRVYREFNDLNELVVVAERAVAQLRRHLDSANSASSRSTDLAAKIDGIPRPPKLYAEPRYVGSHEFVGRLSQLAELNDWADPSDPHAVLLFDAIGGNGKSILTWVWTTRHAAAARQDWAGYFWYSFYERGAVMANFCAHALSYMTRKPLSDFANLKQKKLTEMLLQQLQTRPWLLVLDGLERVLVAYHRYDAAQLADERAGRTDKIARRDPCATIRPDDDDLLYRLSGATPSKILITSRLVPRTLLNSASKPIPGVMHKRLAGLRPEDAESLVRACGIEGSSHAIRTYLQRHCDCHPLVIGVIAGLINDYLPARGKFDTWATDPNHGGQLDVGELDLIQKRNHILNTAIAAVPDAGQRLLSTLALLSEPADFKTLRALNPHGPSEPEFVPPPAAVGHSPLWDSSFTPDLWISDLDYASAARRHTQYRQAYEAWESTAEVLAAQEALKETVLDLERRGLLQYDRLADRYDLHPVVRGVAASGLHGEDREVLGQKVIDHFSAQLRDPYEGAESLYDLRYGLTVVRTLLRMGRIAAAYEAYRNGLGQALQYNLEEFAEVLTLLRPFFGHGWAAPVNTLKAREAVYLATEAAKALHGLGEHDQATTVLLFSLATDLERSSWQGVNVDLCNLAIAFDAQNKLAWSMRCLDLAVEFARIANDTEGLFRARLLMFRQLAKTGQVTKANLMWKSLNSMGRDWSRNRYRLGDAETYRAQFMFDRGTLSEATLALAEGLAVKGHNRVAVRELYELRGNWLLSKGDFVGAVENLTEAVRMARESGVNAADSETRLALARFRLVDLPNAEQEAKYLSRAHNPAHLPLAELWHALGDAVQARKHALAAYHYASADGKPYTRMYMLKAAAELLRVLQVDAPAVPNYNQKDSPKLSFEDEVADVIVKLRELKLRRTRNRLS